MTVNRPIQQSEAATETGEEEGEEEEEKRNKKKKKNKKQDRIPAAEGSSSDSTTSESSYTSEVSDWEEVIQRGLESNGCAVVAPADIIVEYEYKKAVDDDKWNTFPVRASLNHDRASAYVVIDKPMKCVSNERRKIVIPDLKLGTMIHTQADLLAHVMKGCSALLENLV